jgi:hypothetical protein
MIAARTAAAQTTGDKRMIHLPFDVPVHHNLWKTPVNTHTRQRGEGGREGEKENGRRRDKGREGDRQTARVREGDRERDRERERERKLTDKQLSPLCNRS